MRYPALSLGLIALLIAPASTVLARQHAHPAATSAPLTTAPAKGHATDAALRQQMRAIRAEVAVIADTQMHGEVRPVVQGATRIIDAVNTIIVNCKLPPASDAALHEIIGPILQHAAELKADPAGIDAVTGIRSELARYAREFDDPGFAAPAE